MFYKLGNSCQERRGFVTIFYYGFVSFFKIQYHKSVFIKGNISSDENRRSLALFQLTSWLDIIADAFLGILMGNLDAKVVWSSLSPCVKWRITFSDYKIKWESLLKMINRQTKRKDVKFWIVNIRSKFSAMTSFLKFILVHDA